MTPAPQRGCRALEDHFLDLLAGCRHVNRLVLVGDVPPSFPVRVSRRSIGVSLRLAWINPQMWDFMERAEEERDEGKSAPYPDTFYWETDPATQFILTANETANARWDQHMGRGVGVREKGGCHR